MAATSFSHALSKVSSLCASALLGGACPILELSSHDFLMNQLSDMAGKSRALWAIWIFLIRSREVQLSIGQVEEELRLTFSISLLFHFIKKNFIAFYKNIAL